MKKPAVEIIGTFFLALTIGLAAGVGYAGELAPVAIASVLMAMIYAGGHISGAHYNPAATLAFWICRKSTAMEAVPYVAAQLTGAILAVFTVGYLVPDAAISIASHRTGPLFLAEVLFTFALCWVILNVAAAKGTEGNSFYGLAIAWIVAAGAFAVGPVSSAVFNPAVAVALCVIGILSWSSLWIYIVAQLVGAALAAWAFKSVTQDD